MTITNQTILVLAPHTDDGELGAGGLVRQMVRNGCTVHYVAFSSCEQSLPAGFEAGTLEKECRSATKILGIPDTNVHIENFHVRTFADHRQAILDRMIQYRALWKPDLVLIPAADDIHQDHEVIAKEAQRAFKHQSILAYELPWNTPVFHTRLFVELTQEDFDSKVAALKMYKSQQQRAYFQEAFLSGLARVRGVQAGVVLAEAFEIVRMILK